jgi:hypothetical protein
MDSNLIAHDSSIEEFSLLFQLCLQRGQATFPALTFIAFQTKV